MGNFRQSKGRSGFGRPRSSEAPRYGGRDRNIRDSERRPLQMHEVTCDKCGKQCEVPFRPKGDKPVYCSECFEKPGSSKPQRRDYGQDRSNPRTDKLDEINSKLDKIMKALKLE